MALPASGALSISQISVELGRTAITQTALNETSVRTLAGVASGAISISNFYGKSAAYVYSATISSNTQNYNIRSSITGWNGTDDVKATITINAGVYVGSSSTGTYAFDIGSPWPAGTTIGVINNGTVLGRGGNGGQGHSHHTNNAGNGGGTSAINGAGAGPALVTTRAATITNNGRIAGGGGGGGGGAAYMYKGNPNEQHSGLPGGGGIGGSSGGGGAHTYQGRWDTGVGNDGNYTTAGAARGNPGGHSGAGGGYGSAGSNGTEGHNMPGGHHGYDYPGRYGYGGAAGASVAGNSNITWPSLGTRDGGIS